MSVCPRCQKSVYDSEAVRSRDQQWHPQCFQCGNDDCLSKRLCSNRHYEKDGVPYCRKCYASLFGGKPGCGMGGSESRLGPMPSMISNDAPAPTDT